MTGRNGRIEQRDGVVEVHGNVTVSTVREFVIAGFFFSSLLEHSGSVLVLNSSRTTAPSVQRNVSVWSLKNPGFLAEV